MIQLSHPPVPLPGVQIEATPPVAAPSSVAGTPVFLGLASAKPATINSQDAAHTLTPRATLTEPQIYRFSLWSQFQQRLQTDNKSYLAAAVRGFFENGGQSCYVVSLPNHLSDTFNQGLELAESVDADLICAPDIVLQSEDTANDLGRVVGLQQAMLTHCKLMGDRFAILDTLKPGQASIELQCQQRDQLLKQREQLSAPNGDYGALYAPWLQTEAKVNVPPCGHVAGVYARCDLAAGVHQAPANFEIDRIIGLSPSLTDADQSTLSPAIGPSINCIRAFQGRGIRLWGARTLSHPPEWQFINVRRLFLAIHRWIDQNLSGLVFEPNTPQLWLAIERELTLYFETLHRQGALKGQTSAEAFSVICNPNQSIADVRNSETVVANIWLAPVVPAEFIQLALVHGDTGVTLVQS